MDHLEEYKLSIKKAYRKEDCLEAIKNKELCSLKLSTETGVERLAIIPENNSELWLESFATKDENCLINALELCMNLSIPLKIVEINGN